MVDQDLFKPHTVECNISVKDFTKQQLVINFTDGRGLAFDDFKSYEVFAKMVYSKYMMYKYVFEKVKK